MYTIVNFKTKKALKEAVKAWVDYQKLEGKGNAIAPRPVRIFQPGGIFNPPEQAMDYTGKAYVEGQHYPTPHTWYAEVELKDGVVVKVK